MAKRTVPRSRDRNTRRGALDGPLGPSILAATVLVVGAIAFTHLHTPPRSRDLDLQQLEEMESEPRFVRFTAEPEVKHAASSHRGEEGKMGKPSSKQKSGLYALKGPGNVIPQMARGFSAGNDDADVWGGLSGTEIGEAAGVGGLGLVGTGRGGGGVGSGTLGIMAPQSAHFLARPFGGGGAPTGDDYAHVEEADLIKVADDPLSTFSVDVDTASYSNVRRFIRERQLPPVDAVRVEEMINAFEYDYRAAAEPPITIHADAGDCPWDADKRLLRIGLKAMEVKRLPPRNLVFLVDTSGSMQGHDRLALVKDGLRGLAKNMRPEDHVAIVTYAGSSRVVLPPTSGRHGDRILAALDRLESGGSTHGSAGIEDAYDLAKRHFDAAAINRVVLATDGDFNVGVTSEGQLTRLIEEKRKTGVFLTVLGVGRGNLADARMEALADKGNGNYAYLDSRAEARRVLVTRAAETLVTVAKDVKLQVEFNPRQVASYRLVGYENRKLAHRDFNDDKKDAGDVGSGHTVTALYEIVPAGGADGPEVDALRYQGERTLSGAADSAELALVKVRFKVRNGKRSRKIEVPVFDAGNSMDDASTDLRFQAAVAAYGLILRNSKKIQGMTLKDVARLASAAVDGRAERRAFVDMVKRTATLEERS